MVSSASGARKMLRLCGKWPLKEMENKLDIILITKNLGKMLLGGSLAVKNTTFQNGFFLFTCSFCFVILVLEKKIPLSYFVAI